MKDSLIINFYALVVEVIWELILKIGGKKIGVQENGSAGRPHVKKEGRRRETTS